MKTRDQKSETFVPKVSADTTKDSVSSFVGIRSQRNQNETETLSSVLGGYGPISSRNFCRSVSQNFIK